MRLTFRLAAWLVAGNCAVLGLYGYLAVWREVESLQRAMEHETDLAGRALLAVVEETWRASGEGAALALIAKADARQPDLDFRWVPPGGGSDLAERLRQLGPEESLFERRGGRLYTVVPFVPPTGERGGALEVSKSLGTDERYVGVSLGRLVAATAVSVVVSALVAVALSRRVVGRPIDALLAKVRRTAEGDLSGPVHLGRSDEIGRLADAVDAMAADLARARERAVRAAAEREAATRQLRHAERLATVGRLASGVAHELGTPLNVLLARIGLICKADVPEAVKAQAEDMREQVRRMSRTIRQLLDFARRNEPRRVDADLSALAARTLASLEPIAAERRVPLRLGRAPETAPAWVDPDQLQQVLTNLLVNAIHASQGRDRPVTLEVAKVLAAPGHEPAEPRECWRLAVRDEGCGIPEEHRQRIFEPFFTTKDVGEGTGLGLTVAHGIVAEHDGWIEVESRVGVGTEVAVLIPCVGAAR